MKILVTGGTGAVGSILVKALMDKGAEVTVMTSNSDKIADLPNGVGGVVANFNNSESIETAFSGYDSLFLLNTVSPQESSQGLAGVEAAKKSGIKKIVYMSVFHVEELKNIPHFGSKIPIEDAVINSGIPFVILRPNNFFQNDYWFVEVIKDYKTYPQPMGRKGTTRVDIRDIADAAVKALTSSDFDNNIYPINGPEQLKGEDMARVFSDVLGEDIGFMGNDLEAWGKANEAFMPKEMIEDMQIMYKHFDEKGFSANDEDMKKQKEILGDEPRNFADFAREMKAVLT
jgi:uncharacterized protein YbjT (DUF2867 family)